ncbi:MAG: hypothetical protein PVF58_18820 [Candidatus Methanofastidiosia archaeon]
MKDEDVVETLRMLKNLRSERRYWNVAWPTVCAIASLFMPLIAIFCAFVGFAALMHHGNMEDTLMDKLRQKGCLCVL